MKKLLLGGVAAAIVGLLFLLARGAPTTTFDGLPGRGDRTASGLAEPGLPDPLLGPPAGDRRADAPSAGAPPAAGDDFDLEAVLVAVARAEAAGDERALEDLLVRVAGDRARLGAILDLLERDESATSAVARRGGIVAIAVAFARWSRGAGPEGLDAQEFCESVLHGLPRQPAATRELLIAFLVGTDHGDVPAISGAMLPTILALCTHHPEDAELYARLLERLGQDPLTLANHRGELLALVMGAQDGPLVAPALRALLALDPESGAATARTLLDAAPAGSALRQRIVQSLAGAAPAPVAVEVVASAADGSDFAAFEELARRPEAREEVRSRYNALVAAGIDVRGRRNLVASMNREDTGTLLGIAGTDPSLEVRRQAFLTATVSRDVGVDGVRSLRDAYARRGTPGGIDARGAVMSASNALRRSNGAARDEALGLLGDIARDTSLLANDRRMALAKLRPHVPRESLADLESLDADGTPHGVR